MHDFVVVSDLLWVDVTMSMVKVKADCRVSDVSSADTRVHKPIAELMVLRAVAHTFIEPADSYGISSSTG